LNKIPKLRPTYAALLRHAWLAPLIKPPTISEDEEAEKAAEAGDSMDAGPQIESSITTADKEVADWVKSAIEKKQKGQLTFAKKPALHEAPLDAVPGSPLMSKDEAPATVDADEGAAAAAEAEDIKPNPGVRVNSPELISAKIEPVDFANLSPEKENGK
jgi:mitogen-activated protein kinase kinase